MTLSREVHDIYVRRADESLRKHRRDRAGMCDWCAAVWRQEVEYPCLAARIAIAIKRAYREQNRRHLPGVSPE